MLSRVADNLYWFGRYLQRAENTARLIMVNASLLLDLPKHATFGWGPLIEIVGAQETFKKLYPDASEASVVSASMAIVNSESIDSSATFCAPAFEPVFDDGLTTLTSNMRAISPVPSVEQSSTTTTLSGSLVCACRLCRVSPMLSRSLYAGTMTVR